MYTREYLIALFFPSQHPYWFVSILPRNPIPFSYPYFPNLIPFLPKNYRNRTKNKIFLSISVRFHHYPCPRPHTWHERVHGFGFTVPSGPFALTAPEQWVRVTRILDASCLWWRQRPNSSLFFFWLSFHQTAG